MGFSPSRSDADGRPVETETKAEASGKAELRLEFTLEKWHVWQDGGYPLSPGWPQGGALPANGGSADVAFLPMMQRRRLSPLAKAAIAVAWACHPAGGGLPSVFYSSHGESHGYFDMLNELAEAQDMSPSRFSLSVHNAIAGLYALYSGSRSPYVALAGGGEGVFAAFLEAAGLIAEGAGRVLVVGYEQPLPEVYRNYAASPDATTALGLRLGAAGGRGPRLSLRRTPDVQAMPSSCSLTALAQTMLSGKRSAEFPQGRCIWHCSLGDG